MLFNYQTPFHFIDDETDICGILGWKMISHVTERNLSQYITQQLWVVFVDYGECK